MNKKKTNMASMRVKLPELLVHTGRQPDGRQVHRDRKPDTLGRSGLVVVQAGRTATSRCTNCRDLSVPL
jgi:hypothetical protein